MSRDQVQAGGFPPSLSSAEEAPAVFAVECSLGVSVAQVWILSACLLGAYGLWQAFRVLARGGSFLAGQACRATLSRVFRESAAHTRQRSTALALIGPGDAVPSGGNFFCVLSGAGQAATQPLVGAATVLHSGNGTPVGEARAESGQILAVADRCHPVFRLVTNG